jgi:5-methyltetrahydrofolate--homocysteine methyltransferase
LASIKPQHTETIVLHNIDLRTIAQYIHWSFFFTAWRIGGNYQGIEQICSCTACETAWIQKNINPEKAKEALQLFRDAQDLLLKMIRKEELKAHVIFRICPARSFNEGILFQNDTKEVYIPMLRQQEKKETDYFLSLSDFVSPQEDFVGVFAVSISGADEIIRHYNNENDTYTALLAQSLADRLAEATTEWMHEQVRKKYWAYAPDENLSIADMLKVKYQGIRPAVGYPSLPDQSIIFDLSRIIDFKKIGISLTENGAMFPNASTCGLLLSHPRSQYFMIGKIGKDQFADYAKRKGITPEETRKWLVNAD